MADDTTTDDDDEVQLIINAYERGRMEEFGEVVDWLTDEINVTETHYFGESDPEEKARIEGRLKAYNDVATMLRREGVEITT